MESIGSEAISDCPCARLPVYTACSLVKGANSDVTAVPLNWDRKGTERAGPNNKEGIYYSTFLLLAIAVL